MMEVFLYIWIHKNNSIIMLPNIKINDTAIRDVKKGGADSLYISAVAGSNKSIYETLHKHMLWVSKNEGDVRSSDISVLWLKEENTKKAYELLIQHRLDEINTKSENLKRTFKQLSDNLTAVDEIFDKYKKFV